MDDEIISELYNACDPDQPVGEKDSRNVDIDRIVDGDRPRGLPFVDDLVRRVRRKAKKPLCEFLSGLRGSGKSTELLRLQSRLEAKPGPNLLVALIDAEEVIDLNVEIDLPDLLLVLLFGTERCVLQLEERNPETEAADGLVGRFLHWISETEVEVGGGEVSAGGKLTVPGLGELNAGTKLNAMFKTRPSLRDRFRKRAAADLQRLLTEVRAAFDELLQRARLKGRGGVFIILDSLEKLRGTSTSWRSVLDSAEIVLRRAREDVNLPVHVLYTVPPGLLLRVSINELNFLPMVRLRSRAGQDDVHGFRICRELISKRVPDDALRILLGAEHFDARVRKLIIWSGGYPRELIRLLQDIVNWGDDAAVEFDAILARASNNITGMIVTEQAWTVLAVVAVDKTLSVDEQLQPFVDELLSNNVILRYQNHDQWYDVHPAVESMASLKIAIEKLRIARNVAKD